MNKKYLTNNFEETERIAEEFAKKIISSVQSKSSKAVIIGLNGELGSGKTTFLHGMGKGFRVKEKISSPTFLIFKKLKIEKNKDIDIKYKYFYHFDCYRIQKPKELLELGFDEIINSPNNIVAIEWSNRVKDILPNNIIQISFKFIDRDKREIIFK